MVGVEHLFADVPHPPVSDIKYKERPILKYSGGKMCTRSRYSLEMVSSWNGGLSKSDDSTFPTYFNKETRARKCNVLDIRVTFVYAVQPSTWGRL